MPRYSVHTSKNAKNMQITLKEENEYRDHSNPRTDSVGPAPAVHSQGSAGSHGSLQRTSGLRVKTLKSKYLAMIKCPCGESRINKKEKPLI